MNTAEPTYRDHLERYGAAGWPSVLPLPSRRKFPPPTGWTGDEAPMPSVHDCNGWLDHIGNVALRLPGTVIGLDVDLYKPDHAEAWDTFRRGLTVLPATVMSSSRDDGSGIRLYRIADGLRFRGAFPWGEVIQRHHRYVIAPPSIHDKTGQPYRWLWSTGNPLSDDFTPELDELPALPADWIEALQAAPTPAEESHARELGRRELTRIAPEGWAPSVTEACERALGWMQRGTRHDAMVQAAGTLARLQSLEFAGAGEAWDRVRARFVAAVAGERNAETEVDRAWAYAAAQVAASPSHVPPRGERIREYRERDGDLPEIRPSQLIAPRQATASSSGFPGPDEEDPEEIDEDDDWSRIDLVAHLRARRSGTTERILPTILEVHRAR